MLAVTASECSPSTWGGQGAQQPDDGAFAFAHVAQSPNSTTNSSPPNRATVSLQRMQVRRRSATAINRRSPTAWPRVSLICLNPSRSR